MPYINIATTAKIDNKKKILEEISILVSSLTNKSRRFVMAKLSDNFEMYFEDETPCCFLEIKSIGSLNPSEMAKPISNFVKMIEFKRSKKSRSKNALFNPYKNGISQYDLAYLSSKKVLKNKVINLQNNFQKDNLAA